MPTQTSSRWVVVDGPFPNAEPGGDEFPEWVIAVTDDDGADDVVGHTRSYEAAVAWGRDVAKAKRLPLEIEADRG
jgi:hypothetical protein